MCLLCILYHCYITKLCPPNQILVVLDEMLREEFSNQIDAKVFILWALFRAYFYGESDYMYWHEAFMSDKSVTANVLCNAYLIRIHAELNGLIEFYKNDMKEREKIELIKMQLNLYFHFKSERKVYIR
jgi:hypothetical protein